MFDEEDDAENLSPPPLPRKVSFSNEERVSESPRELVEMLKATRTLQQLSSGRAIKHSGGDFECAGRQFSWDGSDGLKLARPEPSPPAEEVSPPRLLSLASILNNS